MKRFLTHNILSALKEASLTFSDLCIVMATTPYGSSLHRLSRTFERQQNVRRNASNEKKTLSHQERRTLSSILSRLKKDSLIISEQYEGTRHIRITTQGVRQINYLDTKKANRNILPQSNYILEKGKEIILIMFDIPEQQKHKRAWLREMLHILEFRILQKSVWIGTTKIPKLFLNDLREQGMLPYVEILAITKSGTLKDITWQAKDTKNTAV